MTSRSPRTRCDRNTPLKHRGSKHPIGAELFRSASLFVASISGSRRLLDQGPRIDSPITQRRRRHGRRHSHTNSNWRHVRAGDVGKPETAFTEYVLWRAGTDWYGCVLRARCRCEGYWRSRMRLRLRGGGADGEEVQDAADNHRVLDISSISAAGTATRAANGISASSPGRNILTTMRQTGGDERVKGYSRNR